MTKTDSINPDGCFNVRLKENQPVSQEQKQGYLLLIDVYISDQFWLNRNAAIANKMQSRCEMLYQGIKSDLYVLSLPIFFKSLLRFILLYLCISFFLSFFFFFTSLMKGL